MIPTSPRSYTKGTCTACDAGKYANSGVCRDCEAGKYSSSIAATSAITCHECNAGRYSSSLGETNANTCLECDVGMTSDIGATTCTICRAGKFASAPTAASSCINCNAGRYSGTEGATSISTCLMCDIGKASDAGVGVCTICEAGKYASATIAASSCTDCVAGRYSGTARATSAETCVACEVGKASSVGSSTCTMCIAGQYASATTSATSCIKCPSGRYSVTAGKTSCTACSSGTYSTILGASSPSDCLPCGAGLGSPGASFSCAPCQGGSYSGGDGGCVFCPTGRFSKSIEAKSINTCLPCEAGKTSDIGAFNCSKCESSNSTCSSTRNCFADEYNNNGQCTNCNKIASMVILAGSFMSFAVVGFYSVSVESPSARTKVLADTISNLSLLVRHLSLQSFIASNRAKMMRLKVLTTFFQTVELTTLIRIPWPKIVFLTLPFQFPTGERSSFTCKCSAADSDILANTLYTTYAIHSTHCSSCLLPSFVIRLEPKA